MRTRRFRSEPNRRALYDYVVERRDWVSREQAAEALGLQRGIAAHHLDRLADDGLLQIDYVNLVVPAQYQVLFSRLGPYARSILHDLVYHKREFTEQWAHEASIVPVESWPLLDYRRQTHRVRPYGFEAFLEKTPGRRAALSGAVRAAELSGNQSKAMHFKSELSKLNEHSSAN